MPQVIKKDLITLINDKLSKIVKELEAKNNNTISGRLDYIKEKYDSFIKEDRQFIENNEARSDMFAYYLFAKRTKMDATEVNEPTETIDELLNKMQNTFEINMDYVQILLDNLTKAFLTDSIDKPVQDLEEINLYGSYTKSELEKNKKEKENKQKEFKKQQEKQSIEYDKIKEKEKEEKRQEEYYQDKKDIEEANKIYNSPDPKPEPKVEYVPPFEDTIHSEVINGYINTYTQIYSNEDSRPIFNTYGGDKKEADNETYFKRFSDEDIAKRISSGSNEPTLSNVIDKVAMYKAQQEKFNKFGFFKKTFSFFYKDANQIKNNMNNLEKSIEGCTTDMFKLIANGGNSGLALKNLIHSDYAINHPFTIKIDDKNTKTLFDNKKVDDKRRTFFETHEDIVETRKEEKDKLINENKEKDKLIDEYLTPKLEGKKNTIEESTREKIEVNELNEEFTIVDNTAEEIDDALNKAVYYEHDESVYDNDNVLPVNK